MVAGLCHFGLLLQIKNTPQRNKNNKEVDAKSEIFWNVNYLFRLPTSIIILRPRNNDSILQQQNDTLNSSSLYQHSTVCRQARSSDWQNGINKENKSATKPPPPKKKPIADVTVQMMRPSLGQIFLETPSQFLLLSSICMGSMIRIVFVIVQCINAPFYIIYLLKVDVDHFC